MALNEHTEERIFQSVVADLKLIREASGFWFDIDENSVSREYKTAEQIVSCSMPYLQVIDGDTRRVPEESLFPKQPLNVVTVIIDGLVKETNPQKRPTAINRVIKDVEKAIYSNPTRKRDGDTIANALVSHVATVDRFDAALGYDDFGAFRMTVEVYYRHVWGDP